MQNSAFHRRCRYEYRYMGRASIRHNLFRDKSPQMAGIVNWQC
jgi:hypothetical protein